MQIAALGIMARLKEATNALHGEAEGHPVQRNLAAGKLTRGGYAALLGQFWHLHRALEGWLLRAISTDPAFAAVVHDWQFKESSLLADLEFLGANVGQIGILPATAALAARIAEVAASRPRGLLGYHYVLEGSTNGGKYVARAVRNAYRLPPGSGTRYYDPYGPEQSERWQTFKRDMDSVDFSETDAAQIIAGACDMFRGMMEISEDLNSRMLAPVVAA